MKTIYRLTTLLVAATAVLACGTVEKHYLNSSSDNYVNSKPFDDVLVRKSGNLLYADLPGIAHKSTRTKSAGNDSDLVSLESLLDRSKTEATTFNSYHIVQIPFKDVDCEQTAILSSNQGEKNTGNTSIIKKFLVEAVDTVLNERRIFVATFFPTPENCEEFGPDSYSYLDKGTFEGLVLFCDLDGKLRGIGSYGMRTIKDWTSETGATKRVLRPIRSAKVIRPEDAGNFRCVRYINLYSTVKSRSDGIDGGELDGSICIGERPKKGNEDDDQDENDPNDNYDGGGGGEGEYDGGDAGGGNNDNINGGTIDPSIITEEVDTSSADSTGTNPKDELMTYIIRLYKKGPGKTYGTGTYNKSNNFWAVCEAVPDEMAYFDRWTGAFNRHGHLLEFRVNKNITSTAYFAPKIGDAEDPYDPANRPCYNDSTGVGNPLSSMTIASPGYSGLRGGTFGYVRSDGKKFHSGLDLYAEEGTPVYAMIDGIISKGNYVTTQPNKETDEYPNGYSGDINKAGNRVTIQGEFNGKDIQIGYWHLQAETPLEINPRTGKVFKPGDQIFRGELLGYTGRTGNAYNVTNKHLHLVYKIKNSTGKYVYSNPEAIINGSINWKDKDPSTKKITDENIIDIKCSSEKKNYYF